jgi:signal transduction histidine kinase
VLRAALGDDRAMRVVIRESPSAAWPPGFGPRAPPGMGARGMGPPGMGPRAARAGPHHFAPGGMFFMAQVQLRDGTWVTFDTHIPQESADLPWRLLLTLLVLLSAVLILAFVAVRWITRPLHVLASAAEELGKDINRAPLPETGPTEVRRAAHAFNTMQGRLVRFIRDRTRVFAAMSHDLKSPITRMRLRAELLEDDDLRARFEKDLREMESMVTHTLDFMRGIDTRAPPQPIDVMALLESLQADNQEMGRTVAIAGRALAPYKGDPARIKRCLANLVDNAVLYGKRATVSVEDAPTQLIIRIRDAGPGIPEDELDKVMEPFYRLEGSRNRETGGTGLGLAFARNIAQSEGGELQLRNHPDGGLEACLTLPREAS